MLRTHHLAIRKYIFDNNIDFLDRGQFSDKRFLVAIQKALALAHFYKENQDEDVMEKDTLTVLSRMATRSLYVAEMETGIPDQSVSHSEIVASSMLSDFYLPVRLNGETKVVSFVEAGGMRSVLGGLDLQRIMHAIRLLDRLYASPSGLYFAATFGDAKVSPSNLLRIGFEECDGMYEELRANRLFEIFDEQHRGVRWFRPSVSFVVQSAKYLSPLIKGAEMRRKIVADRLYLHPEVEDISISFDRGWHRHLFDFIDDIAEGDPKSLDELSAIHKMAIDAQFLIDG